MLRRCPSSPRYWRDRSCPTSGRFATCSPKGGRSVRTGGGDCSARASRRGGAPRGGGPRAGGGGVGRGGGGGATARHDQARDRLPHVAFARAREWLKQGRSR